MKWYLSSKNVNFLKYYAEYFPVESDGAEFQRDESHYEALPMRDLHIHKIKHEGLWQKILNFFMGAPRYEIKQFDRDKVFEKQHLNHLEDELYRILQIAMQRKQDKLRKMRSGTFSSDDNHLFALKLIEFALYEISTKAKEEHTRLIMYRRLMNMLIAMNVDLKAQKSSSWIIEAVELSIEKIDEMIVYEREQRHIKAFQDSVQGIQLDTLVRQLNEEMIGSLISRPMQSHIFYQGSRLGLANQSHEAFMKSHAYRDLGAKSKKIFSKKYYYDLIVSGWLNNAYLSTEFKRDQDKAVLKQMMNQSVEPMLIERAIRMKAESELSSADIERIIYRYELIFEKFNRLYVLSNLLGLVKERVSMYGQSSAVLYQNQLRAWFDATLQTLDSIQGDIKHIAALTKSVIPYVNAYEGRGIFLTSDISEDIELMKTQLTQAKQYMRLDTQTMRQDHGEFVELINEGLGILNVKVAGPSTNAKLSQQSMFRPLVHSTVEESSMSMSP